MCQREAPAVAEVYEKYGTDVTFVGIAGRDDLDPIVVFIDDYDVGSFEHIIDETGALWDNFGIVTQPSFIFLDANGEVDSYIGALGVGGLTERLDVLTSN
ncbi:MAG: TlpA family protein disulfide reductase [Acidimicrobiia bacterium]|nr:TlpA family protein disulfide reductase [Acidimicrobiia bacterium]